MPVLGVRCVCVVKMNVLAESVAGGGAFLAGRESWVGSVQDDEGPRLGRVKTPLQSPHFIPYTKGGKGSLHFMNLVLSLVSNVAVAGETKTDRRALV